MSKDHALHNEEVCNLINGQNKYHDWTVTSAFYSALHYVLFEIFPVEHYGEKYTCFDHYCSEKLKNRTSKHEATCGLVAKHLPTCDGHYKWLKDQCMSARYYDYDVSPEVAKEAVKNLEFIKSRIKKLDDE